MASVLPVRYSGVVMITMATEMSGIGKVKQVLGWCRKEISRIVSRLYYGSYIIVGETSTGIFEVHSTSLTTEPALSMSNIWQMSTE